jgi:predicted Zn-dependent protease with MMP-like domain
MKSEMISDEQFSDMISRAMDELPADYIQKLNNVAITYDELPSADQRQKLRLRCDQTLFGLYEGIPLTKRGAGYNFVLPDKITIFKGPIIVASTTLGQVYAHVKHTLWHEIAHFYGLDHDRIHQIERDWK